MSGDRLVAVGSSDELLAMVGEPGRIIDLEGRLVVPGFIDTHTHFLDGARMLASPELLTSSSREELARRLGEYAAGLEPGAWITGSTWDHENWGGELPEASWIDPVTPDNPVFVQRLDGHMALVNSAALRLAEVDASTPDPDGGLIVRDASGEPTGVLKDNAMALVSRVIPADSPEQQDRMFDLAIREALENGVTQIHDMAQWSQFPVFERARDGGRLPIRVYFLPYIDDTEAVAAHIAEHGTGDERLRLGGIKVMVDGSLGSTTAWFYEPYDDAPDTAGFPLQPMATLAEQLGRAHELGLQLAVHAIGDRANDELLQLFEDLGTKGSRPRIEHAQHLTPDAIGRFAELGVVASMQPYHAIDDGRWAEVRIGPERIRTTYAFRSLLDAGARVAFGSDWFVAPLRPLLGIHAAVTRATLDGANPGGWVPAEKITVEEAIRAYTLGGAWAGFQEEDLGTLEVGKLADFVVLSDDLFEIEPDSIPEVEVVMTVVGGKVVFGAEP